MNLGILGTGKICLLYTSFYWFYPAHVYLLHGASCLVYNVLR